MDTRALYATRDITDACFEFAKAARRCAALGQARTGIEAIEARSDAAMIAGKAAQIEMGGTEIVSAIVDLLLCIRLLIRSHWFVPESGPGFDEEAAKAFGDALDWLDHARISACQVVEKLTAPE